MTIGATETLVLASASPTRRRLLEAAGIACTVDPAALDEEKIRDAFHLDQRRPGDCAAELAEAKAFEVSRRHPGVLVIGADQILDCYGSWLGKPRDLDQARMYLTTLRRRRHSLWTAATVLLDGAVQWRHVERASLTMRHFSDAFLADYVAAMGERLCATAGGYMIEGLGAQLFDKVSGDHFAILGLPLLPLLGFLRGRGAIAA